MSARHECRQVRVRGVKFEDLDRKRSRKRPRGARGLPEEREVLPRNALYLEAVMGGSVVKDHQGEKLFAESQVFKWRPESRTLPNNLVYSAQTIVTKLIFYRDSLSPILLPLSTLYDYISEDDESRVVCANNYTRC
jgi:hypothetical protein